MKGALRAGSSVQGYTLTDRCVPARDVVGTASESADRPSSSAFEISAKPPRFAPLTPDQLNVYQKPLGEQIMKVSSVGLGGPYNPLLRSPVLGQRMFDLLYY